ncbi:porin [Paraburkholderia sp. BCC1886]|uniref:porin n=1 Tax=Paraburkholderia sp. BCC1886 TaxID=2562670 RepID=UPI0021B365E9|nr:porin [Paraburkholderia sp. BCC1886]
MKMIHRAFVLAWSGAVLSAHAQSNVTLYGLVDVGFTYNQNSGGHQQFSQTGGAGAGSRVGFRGSEDLGAGLSSVFVLENGFSPANGKLSQGGALFGRQAYVGFSSTRYGALTFGHQYSTVYDIVSPLSSGAAWAATGAGYGTHAGDVDNVDSFNRLNNTIKYVSPTLRGFIFEGLYGLGGVAGDMTRNQVWTVSAAYANGPVKAAAGYVVANQPNFSFWGSKPSDSATANNFTSPILAGFATAHQQRIFTAGASYQVSALTLGAFYSRVQFADLGSTPVGGLTAAENAYRGSAVFNTYEVNARYQVTPSLFFATAYNLTRGGSLTDKSGATYQQINAGADYFLSKRTDIYADAILQRAAGVNSTGARATAAISNVTPSSTPNQIVGVLGLRTRF